MGWGATKSTKPDSASDVWVKSDSEAHFRSQFEKKLLKLRLSSIFSEKNIITSSGQHKNAPTSPPNCWLEDLVMGTRNIVLQCHFLCTSSQWGALRRISTGLKNEAQQFGIPQMGSQVNRVECLLQDFCSIPWECWMYQNTPKKTLLGFYAGFLRLKSWWLKHPKTLFDFQLLHQYPRDFARKMDISFHFLDRGKDMSLTSATGSLLWIAKWTQLALFNDLWNNIAC